MRCLIALALSNQLPLAGAMVRSDPLITLAPPDAVGLPIGLVPLAVAGMMLTPTPEVGPPARRCRDAGTAR